MRKIYIFFIFCIFFNNILNAGVLWSHDFSSGTGSTASTNQVTRNAGGSSYSCSSGNPLLLTNSSSNGYYITTNITVPQGKGVKLSFNSRRKNSSAGAIDIYYLIGGYCEFKTMNTYTNGWVKWGTITPNTSTASSTGCTNQNISLSSDISGGQIINICLHFKSATSSYWIAVDDIVIEDNGPTVTVPNISSGSPYEEKFNQEFWYAPVSTTYPKAKNSGIVMPYHSIKSTSEAYAYIWSNSGAGNTLDHTGKSGDYSVAFSKGYEGCGVLAASKIITKELNTAPCGANTVTLRFDFKTKYPPNSGNYGYTWDEVYTLWAPKVFYSIGEGYNWVQCPVNYYFPTGKWMRVAYQLPKASNIKVRIERGSAKFEQIDNIKVLCDDCSISDKTGANPIGETNPSPNTNYTYTVAATTGATYYRWVIRRKESGGASPEATLYWGAPAGGNPGIVSGQGTQSVVINFGTNTGSYRVMCIPYDSDPGTFASPTDACYAKLGILDPTISSCTAPTITAKANNTATNLTICKGETVNLTSNPSGGADCSGSWNYSWSTSNTSQDVSNLTPNSNTTYKVTVSCSTNSGCFNTSQVVVNVKDISIDAGADKTIALGVSTTINTSVSGGTSYNYSWTTGSTSNSITVSPATTTTYKVTLTDGTCTATDQVVVTVASCAADAGEDETICKGEAVTLTATEGNSYSWTTGATGANINVSPNTTTTYTVTATTGGCSASDQVIVTVKDITISAGADKMIDEGNSTTINTSVSGGSSYNYSWTTGATSNSITVSPITTTTYKVTLTDGTCTATDEVVVVVNSSCSVAASAGANKNICINASVNLNGSGGVTYSWSNGDTTASTNVSPKTNTTYYLTAYDGPNCSDMDTVVVNVIVPNISAGIDKTICNYSSVNITADGGTSYTWNTTPTTIGNPLNVSPTITTTYIVTGKSGSCTNQDTVVVYVNSVTVSAGADKTVSMGNCNYLKATGGTSYLWSNGANQDSISVCPVVTTTYCVTATKDGCTASTCAKITVETSIPANAGEDKTICKGDTATLTASGTGTYSWSNGQTTTSINVSPTTTTTYKLTATNGGVTSTDDVVVMVYGNPSLSAGPDEICEGNSSTLTATGTNSYSWSHSLGTGITKTVSPATNTTYTITGTDLNGCSGTTTIVVNVNPSPTANAGADQTIDSGNTATITATGGVSYTWSNGASGNSINVSPTTTTTYCVTVTDNKGCTESDCMTIVVNPPIPGGAGEDKTICKGDTATLTASGTGTYSWSNGQTTTSINVSPTTTTTYILTITTGGVTSTDDVVVMVYGNPSLSAGPDEICEGNSSYLTATGTNSYSWSHSLGTGITKTVSPATNTTYTITGTDLNGCSGTTTIVVNVNPSPTANAGADQTIDSGNTATITATGGVSYTWSNGASGNSINVSPTTTTTYCVTVTDNKGCTESDCMTIVVNPPIPGGAGEDKTICKGDTATLTASGTGTYSWSNGQTTTSINVSPTTTTTYILTITTGGVTSTDDVVVMVYGNPSLSAGPDEICEGNSSTLTATGTNSYSWSHSLGTGATKTVSPATNTTYTITGTDLNGCSGTTTIVVNVNPSPTANAGADQTIDSGNTATITATGGVSYTWSNGASGNSINVLPTTTTTYCVTVTDNKGCTDSDCMTIVIPGSVCSAVADAGADKTICKGTSVAIIANAGNSSYSWSTGTTGNPLIVSPIITTTYGLTVTNGACTASDEVVIYVLNIPSANAGGDKTICEGQTVELNATGGGTYDWNNGDNTAISIVTPATTTTYIVSVSDGKCVATDDVVIVVNPLPNVSIDEDMTVCSGYRTLVTADGGGTYLWSTGATTKSIVVYPETDTTYKVTVTLNGCTDTEEMNILIRPVPTIDAGNNQSICEGETITLKAQGNATIYRWGVTINDSISVTPDSTTVYFVEGELNSCISHDSVIVFVNQKPVISIMNDTTVCEGSDLQLFASYLDNTVYYWSGPNAFSSIEQTPFLYNIQLNQIGTYTVTPSRFNCVGATVSVNVQVKSKPVAPTITSNSPICEEETLMLYADSMAGASYLWTSPNGYRFYTQNVEIENASKNYEGTYSLRVVVDGCISDAISTEVEILQIPIAFFYPDVDSGISPLDVKFTNSSFYADYYYWLLNDKDSSSYTTTTHPTYTYNEPGKYTVQLIAYNTVGCTDTIYYSFISVENSSTLYIPSAFTPNGDGDNDKFIVQGTSIDAFEGTILTRWGEVIYTWDNILDGWDGKVKGEEAQIGVYLYKIKAKGENKVSYHYTGTVTLIR